MPPLGPLKVLCVVDVTMSQYSNGSFNNPLEINPDGCAISARTNAPTESAVSLLLL